MESTRELVHRLDKLARRSPDSISNSNSSIVARRQHKPIEQVLQADLVTNNQVGAAAIMRLDLVDGVLPDRYNLTEVSGLNGDEGGHDFGGTSHRQAVISLNINQDMTGVGVK